MKKITADTEIEFSYDGSTRLSIGKEAIVVSDEVARVAQERLGRNITVEDADEQEPSAPATTEPTVAEPTYQQLRDRCKELGLGAAGSADELKERIADEEARLKQEEADIAEGRKVRVDADFIEAHPEMEGLKEGDVIDAPAPTE
jgi:hypothetical protein